MIVSTLSVEEPVGLQVGVNLTIKPLVFYSNVAGSAVTWYKDSNSSTPLTGDRHSDSTEGVRGNLEVHGHKVPMDVMQVVLSMKNCRSDDIGHYTVKVQNGFGTVSHTFSIIPAGTTTFLLT